MEVSIQKDLACMTPEELREELSSARTLLASFGAVYYTHLLMRLSPQGEEMGEGLILLPDVLTVPTLWLEEAHSLMEGRTLDTETLGQLQAAPDGAVYVSYFEAANKNVWLCVVNPSTKEVQVRTNQPISDGLPPEVLMWIEAIKVSCGLREQPAITHGP